MTDWNISVGSGAKEFVKAPPTNDDSFAALTRRIRQGNCVVLLGAGISARSYPLWADLVARLSEACHLKFSSKRLTDIAQKARLKDRDRYVKALRSIFRLAKSAKCAQRYHLLARIKFRYYLTINFDPTLVTILNQHRAVNYWVYPALSTELRPGDVIHLHGHVDHAWKGAGCDLVLGTDEFDTAYNPKKTTLFDVLRTIFLNNDVCFLGCGLEDGNLNRIIATCNDLRKLGSNSGSPNPPKWYALVAEGEKFPKTALRAGITPVPYPKIDTEYWGLDEVLKHWAGITPPVHKVPRHAQSTFAANQEVPK